MGQTDGGVRRGNSYVMVTLTSIAVVTLCRPKYHNMDELYSTYLYSYTSDSLTDVFFISQVTCRCSDTILSIQL